MVEPGLDDLLRDHRARIGFSADAGDLGACDVVYVAPDVPTDDTGKSSLDVLDALLDFTLANTRPDAVVVVLSQVPPGYTRARQQAGRLLFYQVETLIFGRAVERATQPERFIVGCPDPAKPLPAAMHALSAKLRLSDPADAPRKCRAVQDRHQLLPGVVHLGRQHARRIVRGHRRQLVRDRAGAQARPPYRRAMLISRPASALPAAIWSAIWRRWCGSRTASAAMRAWSRPGSPTAGTASAGRRTRSARLVLDKNPDATVAVWGLAYKENTASIKNSPSLATIAALPDAKLVLHDPVVNASAAQHAKAVAASDPLAALRGADALMILTPWPEYRAIKPAAIAAGMRGRLVLDPYAVLDAEAARAVGLQHYTLGRAPAEN